MTDEIDFETSFKQRLQTYAGTAVRPVSATEVARSTIAAAATPVGGTIGRTGPRRPTLLVGMAAALLLAAVAGAGWIGGQPPAIQGVFTKGPSLDGGRIANAVALPDGRVVLGVLTDDIPDATGVLHCDAPCRPHLELLDPRTGEITLAGELPPDLAMDAMAVLEDGRVLLVNASSEGSDRPAATVYDPVADRFDAVDAPLDLRTWPFLVTLGDGRVLVGGGEADRPLATAELFDPATGGFSATGSMIRPRTVGATATRLLDGRVLVVGGGPEVGRSAELYDPSTGTFSETGPTTVARGGFHTATRLPDGRVLIVGGLEPHEGEPQRTPDPALTAEVFDPTTGTFTAVGSMAQPRFMHAASLLSDGTVLVAGGSHLLEDGGAPTVASDAEIFDPSSGTFRATGDLVYPRLWPAALAIDDRVLLLGHHDPTQVAPDTGATTEWFD
jgi:hypothetical protein